MSQAALAATSQALEELRQLERKERELEQKVRTLEFKEVGKAAPAPTEATEGDEEQGAKRRALGTSGEQGDQEPKPASSRLSSVVGSRPPASDRPAVSGASDEQQKSRNKRMFGALVLGTLQKAQTELKTDAKLSRRQEIDKEHLAKANQEREELRKKAAAERESSAKELEEVKKQKAEKLAEVENARKVHYEKLYANFRKTAATPAVYWRPRGKDEAAPPAAAAAPAVTVIDGSKAEKKE